MMQSGDASNSQIVGMDVVGVGVIRLAQGGKPLVQALEGQTVSGVDTRRAQDDDRHTGPLPPGAQAVFGIDPPSGARTLRIQAACFVDRRPATVAVNPCRAYVNQPPW